MARKQGRDVLHRWEGNPAISAEDVPFRCNTVFNGAPIRFGEEYVMLLRVEGQQGYSLFALARSRDGFHFEVDPQPAMMPAKEGPASVLEERGIEDPRIAYIAEDDTYYIMYTAVSCFGPRIALAKTRDFSDFERIAVVSEPGNKDGVLFPEKIGGRYVRLDRPFGHGVGNIWISYSEDLVNWGNSEVLITVRPGYWDCDRIGAGAVPLRTERGWFEIYHGVRMTPAGPTYRIGSLLLDLEEPSKVIGRCSIPILSPREPYERIGDVGNVAFASGAILESDGTVKVYYGAADTCICIASARLDDLVARCFTG